MNERIYTLAEQAGYTPLPGFDFANDLQEVFLKKFAKLIVRECVIQCEREWIRNGSETEHNQAIHGCINSIKQHFGIKE